MKEIFLSNGGVALVDDVDYETVIHFSNRWRCFKSNTHYYAQTSFSENGKRVFHFLHNFLLNPEPGYIVDHINGNGLDNQRGNLRIATHTQNMRNRKKHKSSKWQYKGIVFDPADHATKPWRTRITINGKQQKYGHFATSEEAACKYDELAKLHFGEFAKLNFE